MLIQVAVRIQFFAIVGLRSLFPFCLKTKLFRTSRCSQKSLAPFLYFQSFKKESEVVQLCPTLCSPMDCSLPGSSLHGIFQARVLEWVAISFSRGPSRPTDRTLVSHIVGRRFYCLRLIRVKSARPWSAWMSLLKHYFEGSLVAQS